MLINDKICNVSNVNMDEIFKQIIKMPMCRLCSSLTCDLLMTHPPYHIIALDR
jgi:hypothetical protein